VEEVVEVPVEGMFEAEAEAVPEPEQPSVPA